MTPNTQTHICPYFSRIFHWQLFSIGWTWPCLLCHKANTLPQLLSNRLCSPCGLVVWWNSYHHFYPATYCGLSSGAEPRHTTQHCSGHFPPCTTPKQSISRACFCSQTCCQISKGTSTLGIVFHSNIQLTPHRLIHFPISNTKVTGHCDENWGPQDQLVQTKPNQPPLTSLNHVPCWVTSLTFMNPFIGLPNIKQSQHDRPAKLKNK